MQSAFRERLAILRLNIFNTYQIETAYFANNWASLLSTVSYTLTYVVFIAVIFANVTTMAGYTRDQILFMSLISQLNFYLLSAFSMNNNDSMIEDVNKGNLDLVLIKPLPALFYLSFRELNLLALLRDGGIPVAMLVFIIHWHNLSFSPLNIWLGCLAFGAGLVAADTVMFLLSVPVFWKGEAQELSGLFYSLINQDLPWEGIGYFLRAAFIPILIGVSVSTSIFLGKSNILPLTILAVGVGIACLLLKVWVWKLAIRNYTSASS